VDEVVVLADGAVPGALPANCRFRSFRAGTRFGRGVRFASALTRELARGRPVAVVAHMCPIYAVLAAPLARPRRVPVLLWYTHPTASRVLRAAERASTRVLSVDARSFPFPSAKLVAIGHGIDVDAFPCRDDPGGGERLRVLALGRYSAVKGYDRLLQAARLVADDGLDVEVEIHGAVSNAAERAQRDELERLAAGAGGRVTIGEAVPPAEVRRLLARADVLVSPTRAGSADKAVLEAAASCVPVLAASPAFHGLLPPELHFGADDPAELARRLAELWRLGPEGRRKLGAGLRDAVVRGHSADSWARQVLEVAAS
jgi:glycosyltransferase involved in cell wall biosynthesis